MLMAILLAYSTSGITSVKKVCRDHKMVVILKILKYQTQLHFDLRYEKIVPNHVNKNIFYDDDVIDDVTRWPEISPYIHVLQRLAPGTSCKGKSR